MATSKSRKPPCTCSTRSSAPTMSAPASRASAAAAPAANTATRTALPVPPGRPTVPRTIWSALRGSTPSRTASSTVSSNLAGGQRSSPGRRPRPAVCVLAARRTLAWAWRRCSLLVPCWPRQPATLMPMERAVPATCCLAASRSLALRSGILVWAISVELGVGDRGRPSRGRASARPSRCRRRRAAAPGVGGVLVMNVNERSSKIVISTGMIVPRWLSVCGVVLLAEVHDVHAVGTERGADGRGRAWPRPRGSGS